MRLLVRQPYRRSDPLPTVIVRWCWCCCFCVALLLLPHRGTTTTLLPVCSAHDGREANPEPAAAAADHLKRMLHRKRSHLQTNVRRNVAKVKADYYDLYGKTLTDEMLQKAVRDARDRAGERRWGGGGGGEKDKNNKGGPILSRKIRGVNDHHQEEEEDGQRGEHGRGYDHRTDRQKGQRETIGFGDRGGGYEEDVGGGQADEGLPTGSGNLRLGDRGEGGGGHENSGQGARDGEGDEDEDTSSEEVKEEVVTDNLDQSQEGRTDYVSFRELVLVSGASPGWPWNKGRAGSQYWCVGLPLPYTPDPGCTPVSGNGTNGTTIPADICVGKSSYVQRETVEVAFDFNDDGVGTNPQTDCDWIVLGEAGAFEIGESYTGVDAAWSYTCGAACDCPTTGIIPESGQVTIPGTEDLDGGTYQAYLLRFDATIAALSSNFTIVPYPQTPTHPSQMTLVDCETAPRRSMLLDYTEEYELWMFGLDGIYDNWCLDLPFADAQGGIVPGSPVYVDVCHRTDIYQQWLLVEDDDTWRPYQWRANYDTPGDVCVQAFPNAAASDGGGSLRLNVCATQIPFGLQRSHYGQVHPESRIPQVFIACVRGTVCGGDIDEWGCEEIESCDL